MTVLTIRDVPEDARDDLAEAARAQGVSMQKYLLDLVLTEARRAHNRAVLAKARERISNGGGVRTPGYDAADDIRRLRAEREAHLVELTAATDDRA
jgi:antitoxin FitA